jgi:hypothetical protein
MVAGGIGDDNPSPAIQRSNTNESQSTTAENDGKSINDSLQSIHGSIDDSKNNLFDHPDNEWLLQGSTATPFYTYYMDKRVEGVCRNFLRYNNPFISHLFPAGGLPSSGSSGYSKCSSCSGGYPIRTRPAGNAYFIHPEWQCD